MAGINVLVADTDEEADYQFTTLEQMFFDVIRGQQRKIQPPIDPAQLADMGRATTRCFASKRWAPRRPPPISSVSSSNAPELMSSSLPPMPTIQPYEIARFSCWPTCGSRISRSYSLAPTGRRDTLRHTGSRASSGRRGV